MLHTINCNALTADQIRRIQDFLNESTAIKRWIKYLDSGWIVDIEASQCNSLSLIRDCVRQISGQVIITTFNTSYAGWLNQDIWDWLARDPSKQPALPAPKGTPGNPVQTAAPKLDEIIGADRAVAQFKEVLGRLRFHDVAALAGVNLKKSFSNALLVGPIGSGKTLIAPGLALEMHRGLGKPETAPVLVVRMQDIVAAKDKGAADLQKHLNTNKDGIVVLDEIDRLLAAGEPGRKALEILDRHMDQKPDSPIVIATLRDGNMRTLSGVVEEFGEKFPHVLRLEGYDDKTLTQIFLEKAKKAGLECASAVEYPVEDLFGEIRDIKGVRFANAREADTLVQMAIAGLAEKFGTAPPEGASELSAGSDAATKEKVRSALVTLTAEDIALYVRDRALQAAEYAPRTRNFSTKWKSGL